MSFANSVTMDSAQRVTQRAPKSCYPCSKRKMRCSKTTPCTACVRRDIPEQCHREAVVLSKTLSDHQPNPRRQQKSKSKSVETNDHETFRREEAQAIVCRTVTVSEGSHSNFLNHTSSSPPASVDNNSSGNSYEARWIPTRPTADNTPSQTSESPTDGHLTMEAANTLESLAWGSHRAAVEVYNGRNRAWNIQGSLSNAQESSVLDFHRVHIAWTHNVLHMSTFIRECQNHRQPQQTLPEAGWLSLYYAVLSVCMLHDLPLCFLLQSFNDVKETITYITEAFVYVYAPRARGLSWFTQYTFSCSELLRSCY